MTDHDSPLSEHVRTLGAVLGETIAELEGSDMLELVERVRTLSKAHRQGDAAAGAQLLELVAGMTPQQTDVVARAFAWWFVLINLAEERERVRVLRERQDEAQAADRPLGESLEEAIEILRTSGDVAGSLDGIFVQPVLTAHPTEARRRVVAARVEAIRQLMRAGDISGNQDELREHVSAMWTTELTRHEKPDVMDEVRSGLIVVESTLFDAVARLHQRLARLAGVAVSDVPVVFRFASWIGGDRDGNPYVTASLTRRTLLEHARTAVRLHRRSIERLHGHLSVSSRRAGEDLRPLIERDVALLDDDDSRTTVERLEGEPIRQKLALTWRRLGESLASLDADADATEFEWRAAAFRSGAELVADLDAVRTSLERAGLQRLAEGRFALALLQARIFGFHLAPLDIRQDAGHFSGMLHNLFREFGICEDWRALPEEQKLGILENQLASGRPLVGVGTRLEEGDAELFDTLRTIVWAHETFGPESCQSLILSMTTSASDLLGALLLAREAGIGPIDVVPLFETIDDLRNGPDILTRLFHVPAWKEHLEQRSRVQQIMIGYSDSNKDGGYLTANWHLYRAQTAMAARCTDAGVTPRFFHGRGGTIGRGGGPANRAILAQPPGTVRGGLRLTEQGEVISDRYSDVEVAERHMGQVLNAVIRMSVTQGQEAPGEFQSALERMSGEAERTYRSLVHATPALVEYFHQTTVVDLLPELKIGSRPARRKGGSGIGSLRAIPWVFAWSQSRVNLPGWYGLGTALSSAGENGEWDLLRRMYDEWPFFRALIDNAQMSMRKADLRVARLYASLADVATRDEVWPQIEEEYARTEDALLRISGRDVLLGADSWLNRSIDLRNPYIDPMNAIQVGLLEKLRDTEDAVDRRWMLDSILVTINGIAGGLRNTG